MPHEIRVSQVEDLSLSKENLVGYLLVLSMKDVGHCGGLLIVNSLGRPVEFHCTSPVSENKTQKVLYGETYLSFLYSDQIGRALVNKAKRKPVVLMVRQSELTGLQELSDVPVVIADSFEDNDYSGISNLANSPRRLEVGDTLMHYVGSPNHDSEMVEGLCSRLAAAIPIGEPFERVQLAITEAVAVAKPQDSATQAA